MLALVALHSTSSSLRPAGGGSAYLVKISLGLSSLHYNFAEAALDWAPSLGRLLSGLVLRGMDIRQAWRFLLWHLPAAAPVAPGSGAAEFRPWPP